MKKLAARDFEDLLQVKYYHNISANWSTYLQWVLSQCSVPAFEGLLEEPHNARLMKLLYRAAEWHGFAKLRMHTETTAVHLDCLTKEFGQLMRQFRDITCSKFKTMELPCEVAARARQHQRVQDRAPNPGPSTASSHRRSKKLNLLTPKFHFLGDYVHTIRMFGCTDSFSTQPV